MSARYERVLKLVAFAALSIFNAFKNGIFKAFDEVRQKTKGRRNHGNMSW